MKHPVRLHGAFRIAAACLLASAVGLTTGCDSSFAKRKAELWLQQVRDTNREIAQAPNAMSRFTLYKEIIGKANELLSMNILQGPDRVEVIESYIDSALALNRLGDSAQGEELLEFCSHHSSDADPAVHPLCAFAVCDLEVQSQLEAHRIRNHIDELVELSKRSDLSASGENFVTLVGDFDSLWKEQEAGTDHSKELDKILGKLTKVITSLPAWIGDDHEIEIRVNQLFAAFRDNSLARSNDFAPLVKQIEDLATQFPADDKIAGFLVDCSDRFVAFNLIDQAIELGDFFAGQYTSKENDPKLTRLIEDMARKTAVRKAGIDRFAHDWSRNPDVITDETLADFEAALQSLKSQNQVTEFAFNRIRHLIEVIEDGKRYEMADKAVHMLSEEWGEDPVVGKQVQHFCALGKSRIQLAGRRFEFPKAETSPDPINPSDYKGEWFIVVFWKCDNEDSLVALDHVNLNARRLKVDDHQFKLVGINVDTDLEAAQKKASSMDFSWPIILAKSLDQDGANPFAEQYGVDYLPNCMLIDPQGTVEFVGLDPKEAVARIFAKAVTKSLTVE